MDSVIGFLFKVLCEVVLILAILFVAIGGIGLVRVAYYEVFKVDMKDFYDKFIKAVQPKKKVVKKNVKLNESEETYDKWNYRG